MNALGGIREYLQPEPPGERFVLKFKTLPISLSSFLFQPRHGKTWISSRFFKILLVLTIQSKSSNRLLSRALISISPNSDHRNLGTTVHHCQNSHHIHHCRNRTDREAAGQLAGCPSCHLACSVALSRPGLSRCPPSSFLPLAGLADLSIAGRPSLCANPRHVL